MIGNNFVRNAHEIKNPEIKIDREYELLIRINARKIKKMTKSSLKAISTNMDMHSPKKSGKKKTIQDR